MPAPAREVIGTSRALRDSDGAFGDELTGPSPCIRPDLSSLRALAYAASLGQPLLAVHISPDDDESARFKGDCSAWIAGTSCCTTAPLAGCGGRCVGSRE